MESSSESSVDVSLLLEETRDQGEAERLVSLAQEELRAMAEVYPELASTTTEGSETSDSGNSEISWGGWTRDGMGRDGLMLMDNGEFVPVTIGNSSLSDSEEEVLRVRRLLNLISMSEDELNEGRVTQEDESSDSIGEYNDLNVYRYVDDDYVVEFEPEVHSFDEASSSSVMENGYRYVDNDNVVERGSEVHSADEPEVHSVDEASSSSAQESGYGYADNVSVMERGSEVHSADEASSSSAQMNGMHVVDKQARESSVCDNSTCEKYSTSNGSYDGDCSESSGSEYGAELCAN